MNSRIRYFPNSPRREAAGPSLPRPMAGSPFPLAVGEEIVYRLGETRVGAYLRSLTTRFPGPVVADMLCLLRIHAELSIRAKGLLLAREAGLPAEVGPDVRANLEELRYLEKEIGKTDFFPAYRIGEFE